MNIQVIEKKASQFRDINGFGSNDSILLKSLLFKLDVLAVFRPFSPGFSGMAIKTNQKKDVKRFILINSNKSLGHQHFTICHELYHLFIQDGFESMVCTVGMFDKKEKEEYNADIFASNLLMPENGIKSLIPDNEFGKDKLKLGTILKIEQYFSCSRSALLYRLKNLGLITSISYDNYNQNVRRSAVEFGYSTSLYEAGNHNKVIGNYGSLAKELFDSEKISESHYHSLLTDLGINLELLEQYDNEEN
mgnify:CR=1 FL=1